MTSIRGQSGHDKPVRRTKALACFHVLSVMILVVFASGLSVQAALQNEWTFESDADGLPLSATTNCGSSFPLAQFSAGFGKTVFTTNRTLICIGTDAGNNGAWTNGAILNAPFTIPGALYLRYDVAYSFSSSTNDNGGLILGVYFTGDSGNKAAGLVLGYDIGNTLAGGSGKPTTFNMTAVKNGLPSTNGLPLSGTLTAIAEVVTNSPTTSTLKVWYGLNGVTPTDYNAPAFTTNIALAAVTNLRFQATGDIRPTASSTNYAAVDNIRMADTWADISAPIPDFSKGPKVEISRVIITTPKGTVTNSSSPVITAIGTTNTVGIVIRSLGSSASNVISSVASDTNPEYFSITSSNTPADALLYPREVTNTFSVIVETNAPNDTTYFFNAGATADGASEASADFSLTVGALIVYKTNSITVVSTNGLVPGKNEPGEFLDITVTSENIGLRPVSNIVNSLSANPAYFAITNTNPPSQIYPVLEVGAVTSTTYRVEILSAATNGAHRFIVTNQSGSLVWPDSFLVDVFKQGIPSVSPASITINLLAGSITNNTQVVVTNIGNDALTFAITDNGSWGSFYDVTVKPLGSDFVAAKSKVVLNNPDDKDPFTSSTNAGVSSAAGIGFEFPLYGTVYSNFYVTADGYIGLINTTNTPVATSANQTGVLAGGAPLIAPFWGRLISPAGTIKTIRSNKKDKYLVISYSGVSKESGGTNLQFQVALFTNGCIEFRYKNIAAVTNSFGSTDVTIGVQGSKASYTNLAVKPRNGISVRLTPQRDQWVRYATQDVGVDLQSSVGITFTADASKITATTSTTFNAWFNWSTGGSNAVVVTVNVARPAPVYSAVSSLSFDGPAAQVTSALFVITNAGTSPLTFSIRDALTATVGYTNYNSWRVSSVVSTNSVGVVSTNTVVSTNSLVYNWIDISSTGTKVSLSDPAPANPYITAENDGFSDMLPLKFNFPFYGSIYTQFCVGVNGALRLDKAGAIIVEDITDPTNAIPAQMIAPYWGNLAMDANATLKYRSTADQLVVTWENVQQYGLGGGSNQTFQAILKPNGDIRFQYKQLAGYLWPGTTIGLRDTAARISQASILRPGDWTLTTNLYGRVSTQYVNVVSNRAVQFQSARIKVIDYTPSSGSIPAGSNAVITIIGDASRQSVGTNSIATNTILTITYNAAEGLTNTLSATLSVTFTTTNSLEVVFLPSAAGDDGAGLASDAGLAAGGANSPAAVAAFLPKVEGAPGAISLSWTAPQDGAQRIYTIYSTTDLTGGWDYLAAVTNETTYLDTRIIDVPTIYYKITVTEK